MSLSISSQLRLSRWKIARFIDSCVYSLRHRGVDCECNICGFTARRFLPGGYSHPVLIEKSIIGGGIRKNLSCPRCGSTDRQRLTTLLLDKYTGKKSFDRVLMLAPEYALAGYLTKVSKNINFADIEPDRYFWATGIQAEDATELSYSDNSFDLVVCNHVLEHIQDDITALQEIHRVIKPEGFAVLQVPYSTTANSTEEDFSITNPEDRVNRYGQEDHVRVYALNDYITRVTSAGFTSHVRTSKQLSQYKQYALDVNEAGLLFQVTK